MCVCVGSSVSKCKPIFIPLMRHWRVSIPLNAFATGKNCNCDVISKRNKNEGECRENIHATTVPNAMTQKECVHIEVYGPIGSHKVHHIVM